MARHAQNANVLAVGVQIAGQNSRGAGCLQHHGASTIAKQHTGGAILEIKQTRKHFGADHQCFGSRTGLDHGIGNGQGINKAAANGLHVKRGATMGA